MEGVTGSVMGLVERIKTPVGFSEIIATFGDPREFVLQDGTLSPEWERQYLASAKLPFSIPLSWDLGKSVRQIKVHKLLVPTFEEVFEAIVDSGLAPEVKTFGGTFNWRLQKGSGSKLSCHCWGIAIDLNTKTNKQGTIGDMHPGIVSVFKHYGFKWGREFPTPDPMHFQAAEGY